MDKVESERMVSYLYSLNRKGPKLGLERVAELLKRLEEPQKSFTPILIGGTNGKGSSSAILSSILIKSGYRVGAYTSPHLSSLTERISVDGKPIGEKDLFRIIGRIKTSADIMEKEGLDHPTFFETMTAAAFIHFNESECDFGVLEVGMGGRLDATNVTDAPVSIITNISLEHTKILGDTKVKIAGEKAGIIKPGGLLITATRDDGVSGVFERTCKERGSRIMRLGKEITIKNPHSDLGGQVFDLSVLSGNERGDFSGLKLNLLGEHQLDNAACAVGAALELERLGHKKISESAIREGLVNVAWPGRFEIMQHDPLVILDCAKDLEAMKGLRNNMEKLVVGRNKKGVRQDNQKLVTVISISSDKDISGMLETIIPISDEVIAAAHKVLFRALDPMEIAKKCQQLNRKYIIIRDVKEAVKEAIRIAGKEGIVLVCGSVFTVGEAREIWVTDPQGQLGRELNETPRA